MGLPKELLPFGPETLLARMIRLVGSAVDWTVVVASPAEIQPALPIPEGVILARDTVGGQGPLHGIVAGLEAIPDCVEFVYISAVDLPFLDPRWIEYLADVIGENDIAVANVDGRFHPLAAMYRRSGVLPVARDLLESGILRVTTLMERLPCRVITREEMEAVDPESGILRNLNCPDEYRRALIDAALC